RVPRIAVLVRKAYGGGYLAMSGAPMNPDAVLALPTAKPALMGPESAINAIYLNKINELPEDERPAFIDQKRREYEEDIDLYEVTLAVLQRQKSKDPNEGYIKDIEPWLEATLPQARKQGFKIVTNAGGANPGAAARKVIEVAERLGLGPLKIAVVTGDDIFPDLDEMRSIGIKFPNLDTGEDDIDRIRQDIVAANAYVG